MRLLNTPAARILGSVVSWLLFSLCFTLLFESGRMLMGLGGSCASGGPYVIETPCPDAVAIFTPLSILGGLAAAAIGLIFARGFGTPVVLWAWPVLFVGLGIDFLLASFQPGGAANLVVAIVFLVMGLVPLGFVWRVGVRRLFVGTTDARDRSFMDERGPVRIFSFGAAPPDDSRRVTAGDWALALGICLPCVALGVWLGLILFGVAAAEPVPR
ncbi:hypothetical protein [uncultured Microbacterium sp.]|uniref:hypothetical protein n=1 Tax=uncultured Microbacterium sp. TaxID=191216 RepID=UPI0035CA42DA